MARLQVRVINFIRWLNVLSERTTNDALMMAINHDRFNLFLHCNTSMKNQQKTSYFLFRKDS